MTEAVKSGILKYKTWLIFSAKVLIAVGLIIYLGKTLNPEELIKGIKQANIYYLIAALVLAVVNIYLQYSKWRITCKYLLNENRKGKILLSLFYGVAGGAFTPARVGEYFGRAIAFREKPLIQVTAATFVDKIFPLFMTAFWGSMASILFIHFYYHVSPYLTAGLFIIYFVLFYLIIVFALNPRFWNNFLFRNIKKSKYLHRFFKNLKILKEVDRFYTYEMFFLSFLFYSCFILQFAFLASAFSTAPHFINFIWAANLIMFAKTIIPPVSFGEIGIREGAAVFFISALGDIGSVGFNASIFLFFINILIPSIIGLFLLMKRNND